MVLLLGLLWVVAVIHYTRKGFQAKPKDKPDRPMYFFFHDHDGRDD